MKPRQTSRNFLHNPNNNPPAVVAPLYQAPHNQPSILTLPPPNLPPATTTQTAPTINPPPMPQALKDLDLAKSGSNFEEKAKMIQQLTSNPNMLSQDDLIRCFQAIYGKNGADILKNQSAHNELTMQASLSPPGQYPKINPGALSSTNNNTNACVTNVTSGGGGGGGSGGGGSVGGGVVSASLSSTNSAACSLDSLINSGLNGVLGGSSSGIVGSNSAGSGGGASGATSYNNNISKNNNGACSGGTVQQQNKLDIPFLSAQQHHNQTVATSSAINNFRVPTTNAYNNNNQQHHHNHHNHSHSPLTQSAQSPQQKSVLSIHQQHHSDRRFNNDPTGASSSYSNLNLTNMNGAPSSSSGLSSTPFDAINTNQIKTSNPNQHMSDINAGLAATRSSQAMMDAMKVHPSLDNLIETSFLSSHGNNNTSINIGQQQALTGHQQLQRLLKASGVGVNSNAHQVKPQSHLGNSNTMRNDHQNLQQRDVGNVNLNSMHNQRQIRSSISPSQASTSSAATTSHSLPKSLLNLAACSTSPHDSGSRLSALNQLANYKPSTNQKHLSNSRAGSTNIAAKASNRGPIINNFSGFGSRSNSSSLDPNELLQQLMNCTSQVNLASKSKQSSLSLLPDDLAGSRRNQQSQQQGIAQSTSTNKQLQSTLKQKQSTNLTQEGLNNNPSSFECPEPKDSYLANLQERAARAGVSIDEINDRTTINPSASNQSAANPGKSLSASSATQSAVSSDLLDTNDLGVDFDQDEIESALSRVEARNDLSLLYPPVFLGANSQKQINALAAGFQSNEESELFTIETRRIVSEECNIIYECKQCSNLFRSLANLVKHKKTYCTDSGETSQEANDVNRRINRTTNDSSLSRNSIAADINKQPTGAHQHSINPDVSDNYGGDVNSNLRPESGNFSNVMSRTKYNLRGKLHPTLSQSDQRYLRRHITTRSDTTSDSLNSLRNLANQSGNSGLTSTNLTKLLSSQPRSMLSGIRDNSALMNALRNKAPSLVSGDDNVNSMPVGRVNFTVKPGEDVDMITDLNEQLVSKSSLAQTLLNESSKSNSSNLYQSQDKKNIITSLNTQKHVASKRKLEDCISKVKRGKLYPHETAENLDGESDQVKDDADTSTNDDKPNQSSSSALLRALTKPAEVFKTTQGNNDNQPKAKDKPIMVSQKGSSILAKPPVLDKDQSNQDQDDESNKEITNVQSPLFEEYSCDICELEFSDRFALLRHTLDQHKISKTIYPCIFCSLSFIMLENVCRHIYDIHKKGKVQISRLKDVVRSRSYVSEDFTGCNDYPSTQAIDELQEKSSQRNNDNNDDDKSSAETMTPRLVITEDNTTTSQSEQDVEKDSLNEANGATSETSTKELAQIATSSSQGLPHDSSPTHQQQELSISQQSTTIQSQIQTSTIGSRLILTDPLFGDESDLTVDPTDEDLDQLCQQEEEIARLKKEQEKHQKDSAEGIDAGSHSSNVDVMQSNDIKQDCQESNNSNDELEEDEARIVDDKVKSVTVCQTYESDWSDRHSAMSPASDGGDYTIHEEADNADELDCEQANTFELDRDVPSEVSIGTRSRTSSTRSRRSRKSDDYLDPFRLQGENSIGCDNENRNENSDTTKGGGNHDNKLGCDGLEEMEVDDRVEMEDEEENEDEDERDQEQEQEQEQEDDDDEGDGDDEEEEVADEDFESVEEEEEDYDENESSSAGGVKLDSSQHNSTSIGSSAHNGSGSSGASGGGMKLKIQLKTQPDEKTKVYRIV